MVVVMLLQVEMVDLVVEVEVMDLTQPLVVVVIHLLSLLHKVMMVVRALVVDKVAAAVEPVQLVVLVLVVVVDQVEMALQLR